MVLVSSECCRNAITSDFCTIYNMLSSSQQAEIRQHFGDDCQGDADEADTKIEKRKPNFIRFGRTDADPKFLQFGRSSSAFAPSGQNFLRFGRASEPNFLRFGRVTDPNFLRFGKSAEPNFLRFGKRIEVRDPNFLRFGRNSSLQPNGEYNEGFSREGRKPNFLRFGK
uniref:FMRFamide-related neuropeptides n=1 Tax=Elaeophora elaphi TaxID=1147741 RepID=A0A0R3RH51_9BILA